MNIRLMVLGLLSNAPRHGYEIQKWLEQSQTNLWADVLPGSISHVLKQMAREGLVSLERTEHTGHRARAIYAITESGRQELQKLLEQSWQNPPKSFPTAFYTVLAFSSDLSAKEKLKWLEGQIAQLEREFQIWTTGEIAKLEHIPPSEQATIKAIFANGREHIWADLKMLRQLQSELSK